jgi:FixJ family two-component response regulator
VSQTPGTDDRLVSIVDDDVSVGQSTRRLVRSFRFPAEAFASAEEFLASDLAPRTKCLILDVRMPGMDGLALQRRLADLGLQIPIVFLTGRASDEEERRALAAGAVAFLRKPVGRDTLLRVVQQILTKPGGGETHES